jgi:Ca2+/Na+ antiporter
MSITTDYANIGGPDADRAGGNGSDVESVDVRGPRFAAWVTTVVLIAALVASGVSSTAAAVILAAQALIFAVGAVLGPRRHPYGRLFARLIAPRLGPVEEREPAPPLRFAQAVGLEFALVGLVAFTGGAPLAGTIATALALAAAFLNAAFGICLGCQLYPLFARLRRRQATT